LVRPPRELIDAARAYVAVRVTNMAGVDLNAYRFDHDLTFAALVMNADGTVYHRYGSRLGADASARLDLRALVALLRESLDDHAAYEKKPAPPEKKPRFAIEDFASMKKKLATRKIDCMHCHFVYDAERADAQENGTWTPERIWRWPPPERLGVRLDAREPACVVEVRAGSPADAAGIEPGDRLAKLGAQRILSEADVEWVLDSAPGGETRIAFETERAGERRRGELALAGGWKRGDELSFAWRPSMWGLRPDPGFGGRDLAPDEKAKLGLARDAFAFRVGYLIDRGDHAEYGKSAARAGIRTDDVVTGAGGRRDFASHQHFQAWFRLTRKAGEKVEVVVLRGGREEKLELSVLP
jgi:hypothetical protein